jgi:hypothetical protein
MFYIPPTSIFWGDDFPSVGLQQFYSHLAGYMLTHGLSADQLATVLIHESSPYKNAVPAIPAVLKHQKLIQINPLQ